MLKDSLVIKNRHKRFIIKVCETEIVYALENKDGFATSSSVHYDDENEEPVGIICFWAEQALAKSCIINDWSDYKLSEINLSAFLENWCVGMENDGLLIGTEFDNQMFGYEAEPLELILELISELKMINKNLIFKKYDNIIELENQVKTIIE